MYPETANDNHRSCKLSNAVLLNSFPLPALSLLLAFKGLASLSRGLQYHKGRQPPGFEAEAPAAVGYISFPGYIIIFTVQTICFLCHDKFHFLLSSVLFALS